MKTLGEHIRELRKEQDLSLRELARRTGISPAFMSDVELNRRHPSNKHLSAISEALNAELAGLLEFDTRPPLREFQKITIADPGYSLAFRQIMERQIPVEELLQFIQLRDLGTMLGKIPRETPDHQTLGEAPEPATLEEEREKKLKIAQSEANRAIQELNNVVKNLDISGFAAETHPDPGEATTLEVIMYLPDGTLLEELSMDYYL